MKNVVPVLKKIRQRSHTPLYRVTNFTCLYTHTSLKTIYTQFHHILIPKHRYTQIRAHPSATSIEPSFPWPFTLIFLFFSHLQLYCFNSSLPSLCYSSFLLMKKQHSKYEVAFLLKK
uniref:Uncharacterized protein n=1 Tax=Octopus bimaculoides TaxID=37653 RepID=A0A0L8G3E4_OCTBM